MELIRIIKKSILCIICALAAVISICIYQVNSSNDAVTYRYYRQIINDYDKIKEDRVGLTASKLTAAYDTYREEDSEYINKAAELVENKEKYVKSYNSYYDNSADNIKSKNYSRIADSTLFGDTDSYYILNANKQLKDKEKLEKAIVTIEEELKERVAYFKSQNKLIEAQRIEERTNFDIEMMKETGFCQGIENYSRHISGRPAGSPPYTLFDYFPKDFLLLIDESHATIPQVRAMYNGDRARKESLVNYGFRLPSAFDNRPLTFQEFEQRINQVVFVSATPADYEKEHSKDNVVEQIIRPTGLLDPKIEVKPVTNQIDDLIEQIHKTVDKQERVLVTTLTKKMAEDLTAYLASLDIKVKYMHSDIKALERMEIIRDLRLGVFDVLVGINLLREGLDIPEVSLVAILDADKEGFLRSERSLIQTIGRAARNTEGHVIMYADELTDSMEKAIHETNRRREIQMKYNEEHGIIPQTIKKSVRDAISAKIVEEASTQYNLDKDTNIQDVINKLTDEMLKHAAAMEFEKAAELRDRIKELENLGTVLPNQAQE